MWHRFGFLILLTLSSAVLKGNPSENSDSFITGTYSANLEDSVDYLLSLSSNEIYSNPELAFEYASRARDISITHKLSKRKMAATSYMGKAKIETEDYYQAKKYLTEALDYYKDINDDKAADLNYLLGKTNYFLGNYEDANDNYREAIDIYKLKNNQLKVARVLQNIGLIHHNLDDPDKAADYYRQALDINLQLENDTNIAGLLQNLGIIYLNKKSYDKALDYYEKSIHIYTRLADTQNVATTFSNIGLMLLRQGEYEKAYRNFEQSKKLFGKTNYKFGQMLAIHNMGSAKLWMEEEDAAISLYKKSLEMAKELNSPEGIMSNLIALAEVSELTNDFEKAFNYYIDYTQLRDSIQSASLKEKISELEALYKMQTREKELAQSAEELKRQKTQKTAFLIIVVILTIAFTLIYLAYRKKKVTEMEIVSHKLNLENAIVEKTRELENQINVRKIAEDSDKLKSAFLANMSHELRTPMNAIIAFSNFLREPNLTEEKKNEYLDHITLAGDSLLRLIDDIIDIAKIEAKQLKIMISPTNISRLLRELYKVFTELKSKNNYTVNLNLRIDTKNDYIINTDAFRIKQILINLIDNALKYTREGFIEFGLTEVAKGVELYVKDTGIGIPKEKHTKIFERFLQLESEHGKKFGGTGLGLAISKNLAELLGGDIRVESEMDKGSTFYVFIPVDNIRKVEVAKDALVTNPLLDGRTYNWESITILVAEDEELNYKVLDSCLSKTKAKVIRAFNGEAAVELCKKEKIDIVLMDIQMPVMDGYKATYEIKKLNKNMPVIAQTSFAMSNEKEKCIDAGCDDYITKPLDLDNLLSKIERCLQHTSN
ncbi:MAG: tetratricopeptide repeat protein [Bacteroidales bacterium]|nr:tetratricopeptide repeat protein [Bacteroidales bacterium]